MDNLQDILSSVLSDPEAVSKLRSLGKELGLNTDSTGNTSSPQNPPKPQEGASSIDLSALSGLLGSNARSTPAAQGLAGSLSPETLSVITRFLPLLSGMNQEDEATALLNSLRPFLSAERCKRLDEAGKMLKVMRILPKLRSTGLF